MSPAGRCLSLALLLALPLQAQDPAPADDVAWLKEQLALTQEQVAELLKVVAGLQSQVTALSAGAAPTAEDEFFIPKVAQDFEQTGLPGSFGSTYTRPFLSNLGQRTYLGGYFDLEFFDGSGEDASDKFFDQHRFVPFIYADISDRVKFSSELEIEHGEEVAVEFAQVDYLLDRAFNVRAGIQLLPLGKFNEVHDSPINDLTARPLVDRLIIPVAARDAGIGAFGELSDSVSYAATITNGFKGLSKDGMTVITPTAGLRSAAPQADALGFDQYENINDELAYTGRVAWKPLLGAEVGASTHLDTYDEAGENDLRILALDGTLDGKAVGWLPDNMELLGEGAVADLETNDTAEAAGVADDMRGFYVQANAHFEPDFLAGWKQRDKVEEDAHFTFVTRFDRVTIEDYRTKRTTFGLNFRPNARDTVYKLDYQLNSETGGDGGNGNNALVFSVATYF